METIGERLRRIREERGYAQRDISGPGVSCAYVSLIERGLRTPSVKALRVIARNLGTSVEYLETGSAVRESEARMMRLLDAELRQRLARDPSHLEEEFRELYWDAVKAADRHCTTRALIGLGLSAAHRGAHGEVIHRLRRAIRDPWVEPGSHALVYLTLARAYTETGAPDKAVSLLEGALERLEANAPDDRASFVKFTTYLSYALTDMGEPEKAQKALDSIADEAETSEDSHARVRVAWSRARLAADRGEIGAAIEGMHHAIALLEATDNATTLGRAQLMCAEMLLAAFRHEEARARLDLADRLMGRTAEAQDRAVLLAEKAKLAARTGDGVLAVGLAHRSLEILGDEDPPEQGRAYWALAEGLAACGRVAEAEQAFDQAYELLRREGRYLDRLAKARERALAAATVVS